MSCLEGSLVTIIFITLNATSRNSLINHRMLHKGGKVDLSDALRKEYENQVMKTRYFRL